MSYKQILQEDLVPPDALTWVTRSGWNRPILRAYIEGMIENALKLAGLAALILITSGTWPSLRYGAAIAVGVCLMAAAVLHFVAP
jgi:hypothetical protein